MTLDDLYRILHGENMTINITINGPVTINPAQSWYQVIASTPPAEAEPRQIAAPRYSVAPPDADFEERYRQMQRNRAAWIEAEFARLVPPGAT